MGGGDLKKVITVKAHKISENAKRKLASAGAKFDGLA